MNRKFDTTAINQHFAKGLVKAMRDAGVSGKALERLSGVSKSMINKLRHGEHSPTLDMVASINAGLELAGEQPIYWVLQRKCPKAVLIEAPEETPEPAPEETPEPEKAPPEVEQCLQCRDWKLIGTKCGSLQCSKKAEKLKAEKEKAPEPAIDLMAQIKAAMQTK